MIHEFEAIMLFWQLPSLILYRWTCLELPVRVYVYNSAVGCGGWLHGRGEAALGDTADRVEAALDARRGQRGAPNRGDGLPSLNQGF